jgi:WD40 repeat protein
MRTFLGYFAVVLSFGLTANGSDVRTLGKHVGVVRSVAYSPKGKFLASGGDDRTVRIWDSETGKAVATLRGHKATVNSVAFSPDGMLVAGGGDDRTVRIWDAETGTPKRTLAREDIGPVRSVAFSPDGSLLASADFEPTVRLWDVRTGELVRTLFEPSNGMWSVAFSPDGKTVWSVSAGGWVTAWDVTTGRVLRKIDGAGGNHITLAVSPDGRWVASGMGVWDAETGVRKRSFNGSPVAFSPAGGVLAIGGVTLLDLGTWAERGSHAGHGGGTRCLAFSPDGRWLASGGGDGSVKLWPQPRTE